MMYMFLKMETASGGSVSEISTGIQHVLCIIFFPHLLKKIPLVKLAFDSYFPVDWYFAH